MNHRPASFVIATPSAPPHLDAARTARRSTGLAATAPPRRRPARSDVDQAFQAMLETCPVPDRLLDFAAALADEGRTEI